ncbi:MAG: glycosyltransferase family 2 protein [Candidatus Latescibacterota bacterium]|nr:glycosyltransferase family 2 protein [Candidatus Latescibacterota bacterium]
MRSADWPELSICVVNWNTRELLRACLESLLTDMRSDCWQIIVVDNNSADNSAAMVRERFPGVELIESERNLGFSGGNNLGLQQAQGRHSLLLNSDTRVPAGTLGQLVDFLDEQEGVGAAGPRLVNGDGELVLSCGRRPGLFSEILHKLLLHKLFPFFKFGLWPHDRTRFVGWVTGACLMVRTDAVLQTGFLDDNMFMCFEDLDWCMRLQNDGWKIAYFPHCEVVHLEGRSITQHFSEMLVVSQQSLYYLFQKHFSRFHLQVLRGFTVMEMVLRGGLWSLLWLVPTHRGEAMLRLSAYRQILFRTLLDRSYWAPRPR